MNLTPKAHEALQQLLTALAQGTIPEALARTALPALDVPCAHWSLNNRLLTWLAGTADARGLHQWNAVGRRILAGRHAFYILAPLRVKRTAHDPDPEAPDDPTPELRLVGFRATPVFRVEDTEGTPLAYPPLEPPQPPPLWEVAEHWGLTVSYVAFDRQGPPAYGSYAPAQRQITLATHDEQVFFHELAHAAHLRAIGRLHGGQYWSQEVVAELTAATLMHLYGRQPPNDGAAYQYIAGYAQSIGIPAYRACLAVLGDVERCLQQILTTAEHVAPAA